MKTLDIPDLPDPQDVEIPDLVELVTVETSSGNRAVLYELQPKQYEAWKLTPLAQEPEDLLEGNYHKHIGYGGAAGGGKSYLARAVAVHACIKWPGINAVIIRQTLDEVKKNHIKPFWQEVPKNGLRDGTQLYDWNGEERCATFKNGSSLYFDYLKEDGDELRYQGNEYDVIIFEESTHYAFEQVRYLTGERMRATQPYSFPFAMYPSNPGNQGHQWYKRLFIEEDYDPELNEDPDDYAFLQSYVWDNKVLLKKDPTYIDKLLTLPEPLRSWRLAGDWDAGEGLALPMIDKSKHLVDSFKPPSHWRRWSSFDWGYAHPWSFGFYVKNEDGRVFKVCTITGRRQLPDEIAATIKSRLFKLGYSLDDIGVTAAGHDCWNKQKARGENTPTIAEQMMEEGITLVRANISRVSGLNNLRRWCSWKGMGPEGQDIQPMLQFMDEPGNRQAVRQLSSLPADPDNPEDALKQDADDYGHGGDDIYDETRYAMANREPPSRSDYTDAYMNPFDPDALRQEHERKMKGALPRSMRDRSSETPDHPEFGAYV